MARAPSIICGRKYSPVEYFSPTTDIAGISPSIMICLASMPSASARFTSSMTSTRLPLMHFSLIDSSTLAIAFLLRGICPAAKLDTNTYSATNTSDQYTQSNISVIYEKRL